MGKVFVNVLPPVVNDFSGVNNIIESVLIQTIISQLTTKAVDKPALCRFPKLNAISTAHCSSTTGKFDTLIGTYNHRITMRERDAVQNMCDLNA